MNATTIDEDDPTENYYEKQVLKLTTLASLCSIIANILIGLTIIKYKNLRTDATNWLILHVVALQILSLFFDEVLLWFFTYFGTPLPQYHTEFCVMFVGVRMLNAASFLVIILLVFNWYIKLYSTDTKYMQFCKFYKCTLGCVYVSCLVIYPFLTKLCLMKDVFATFYVVLAFQAVMIVLAIYMNLLRRFKSRAFAPTVHNPGLGIANITVLFCTPAYLFLVLAYYSVVPVYMVLFADILATGLFPFVLIYLYKSEKNFKIYFKRMFSCRRTSENECVSYNLINNAEI